MLQTLQKFDWLLFASMFLLIGAGLISLWSLSPDKFFFRQTAWAFIGIVLLFAFTSFDYRVFRNYSGTVFAALLFGMALLVLLFFFAPATRGVTSWFRFGSIAFEPAELIKVILILVLAKYWAGRHVEIYQLRYIIVSGLYVFIPAALVLVQPDLGSAVILFSTWFIMVIFSGIRPKHIFAVSLVALVVAILGWSFLLAPYQKARITSFLDPYGDPEGIGYNSIQSLISVGSGQVLGKGVGYGTQSHLNFLPEAETDFIFAAFAEESGFLGVLMLAAFFACFLWRALLIGFEANDNFSKLFALGFTSLVFFQFVIHTGSNIGILPITGVTLPFVSYGGSSLVTLMIGVGILQSIRIYSRNDTGKYAEIA